MLRSFSATDNMQLCIRLCTFRCMRNAFISESSQASSARILNSLSEQFSIKLDGCRSIYRNSQYRWKRSQWSMTKPHKSPLNSYSSFLQSTIISRPIFLEAPSIWNTRHSELQLDEHTISNRNQKSWRCSAVPTPDRSRPIYRVILRNQCTNRHRISATQEIISQCAPCPRIIHHIVHAGSVCALSPLVSTDTARSQKKKHGKQLNETKLKSRKWLNAKQFSSVWHILN